MTYRCAADTCAGKEPDALCWTGHTNLIRSRTTLEAWLTTLSGLSDHALANDLDDCVRPAISYDVALMAVTSEYVKLRRRAGDFRPRDTNRGAAHNDHKRISRADLERLRIIYQLARAENGPADDQNRETPPQVRGTLSRTFSSSSVSGPTNRVCEACGGKTDAVRRDARFCSDACRKRAKRREKVAS